MTDATTDAPIRGLRKRWEQLRHSGALKDLLEEFALWTALWTGFPLSFELDRAEASRTSSPADSPAESGGESAIGSSRPERRSRHAFGACHSVARATRFLIRHKQRNESAE